MVKIDDDGKTLKYIYNGKEYDSLEKYYEARFKAENHNRYTSIEAWKIAAGYTIVPTLTKAGELSQEQLDNLRDPSLEDLKDEWDKAVKNGTKLDFEVKYGFQMTGEETQADLDALLSRNGIETKRLNLDVHVSGENISEDAVKFIFGNKKKYTKNVELNISTAGDTVTFAAISEGEGGENDEENK